MLSSPLNVILTLSKTMPLRENCSHLHASYCTICLFSCWTYSPKGRIRVVGTLGRAGGVDNTNFREIVSRNYQNRKLVSDKFDYHLTISLIKQHFNSSQKYQYSLCISVVANLKRVWILRTMKG